VRASIVARVTYVTHPIQNITSTGVFLCYFRSLLSSCNKCDWQKYWYYFSFILSFFLYDIYDSNLENTLEKNRYRYSYLRKNGHVTVEKCTIMKGSKPIVWSSLRLMHWIFLLVISMQRQIFKRSINLMLTEHLIIPSILFDWIVSTYIISLPFRSICNYKKNCTE